MSLVLQKQLVGSFCTGVHDITRLVTDWSVVMSLVLQKQLVGSFCTGVHDITRLVTDWSVVMSLVLQKQIGDVMTSNKMVIMQWNAMMQVQM